ncbi:MAG TPA: hypothetical protein VLM17_01965 [Xanthomonadaceae bacterium]|nr:hypothetical protein [Xanthomonadaceae bacterium]
MQGRHPRTRMLAVAGLAGVLSLGSAPALPASGDPSDAPAIVGHCTAGDGGSVYTDKPCTLIGAQPAPMSSSLVARLASDRHVALQADASAPAPVTLEDAAPSAAGAPGRRATASGCARSPQQLAVDLRGSLALGDVNRLAESYHWVGMSYRQGQRTLDRLAHLLGRQALDSRYYAAQIASLSDDGMAGAGDGRGGDGGILQVVLAGRGAPSVVEFDVHRYAGCYFVSFQQAGATIA